MTNNKTNYSEFDYMLFGSAKWFAMNVEGIKANKAKAFKLRPAMKRNSMSSVFGFDMVATPKTSEIRRDKGVAWSNGLINSATKGSR